LYFKNETNIGGEPNFFAAGTRATADHVWIFGDDDVFGPDAITAILSYIHKSYDLIVVNFSDWSRQMDVQLKPSYLPWPESRTFDDSNEILGTFRMHLGYISSIVVRKSILLAVPESDYARFIPYGFPHPYSIYCGLLAGCRVAYDARPLFQRRADNCVHFQGAEWLTNWLRVFLLGTAQIFEALGEKGYSAAAVRKAKDQTVSEHRGGILIPEIGSIDRRKLFAQMWPHYRFCPHFWLFWAPALVFPKGLLRGAHKMVRGKNAQLACGSKP
ncbi:MAG: hypothetical protein P4L87_07945, partial [Formivibrio sp.]|nr:hypothetical protein [Formivibrio sp.]